MKTPDEHYAEIMAGWHTGRFSLKEGILAALRQAVATEKEACLKACRRTGRGGSAADCIEEIRANEEAP